MILLVRPKISFLPFLFRAKHRETQWKFKETRLLVQKERRKQPNSGRILTSRENWIFELEKKPDEDGAEIAVAEAAATEAAKNPDFFIVEGENLWSMEESLAIFRENIFWAEN